MAYRRRQVTTKSYTYKEDVSDHDGSSSSDSSSLAAQAIRASSAHRDSSLSSAYGNSAFNSSFKDIPKASSTYDYTSMKSTNEPGGLWGVLARKAKTIIDEDKVCNGSDRAIPVKSQKVNTSPADQLSQSDLSAARGSFRKIDSPRLQKGFNAITSSLNHIGDSIGTAFEEGRSIMEHKTADIIQETRKLQIRRKGSDAEEQHVSKEEQETLLKASRDVAVATAAKAKLLLREVKTLKADLAFARKRSSQLEEENRGLLEKGGSGNPTDDDDLIRLQLETLLAEKSRLAHENSSYARENRFLREIVEYRQLTMQDVVYLDENIEEVTEVNPLSRTLSTSPPLPNSPPHVSHIQLQQQTLHT